MAARAVALAGSVVGGVLASACCIGPLVLSFLGLSGAAFARAFEPWRPFLLAATYALLGSGFYLTYGRGCGLGSTWERARASRLGAVLLWIVTSLVVAATNFPLYAEYLPF